jgi:hypothetical protein
MILRCAILVALLLPAFAQDKPTTQSEPKVVMVPATIDHDRVIIDAVVQTANGGTERVRAWIDTGNPELLMSRRVASLFGLDAVCTGFLCSAPAPNGIVIGNMEVSLRGAKDAKIPAPLLHTRTQLKPGLDAEIAIPSTVLRDYDVLIDYPGRKFTIGAPGTIHFQGSSGKVQISAENGLIEVPSRIANKKYDLTLDLGSTVSFLSSDLFNSLATEHLDWPNMMGAVGPAGVAVEGVNSRVMRVDRLQFGPLFLTNVAVADKNQLQFPGKPASNGAIGAEALLNYRVGIDYAHSMVYFDIGRLANIPDFDVIGLILRPEEDGRYTILGAADIDGKPSVPTGDNGVQAGDELIAVNGNSVHGATLGAVWSLLGGTPGQERALTIERAGKQFTVSAQVQHFLAEAPDIDEKKGKHKR